MKTSSLELLESRIAPAVFTVTSFADPSEAGKVTLRDALALTDAHAGADTIKFSLPAPPLHGENVIKLLLGELLIQPVIAGDKLTITGRRVKSGAPYINLTEKANVVLTDSGKEIFKTNNYEPAAAAPQK